MKRAENATENRALNNFITLNEVLTFFLCVECIGVAIHG